jgi:hypothetical protein
VGIIDFILNLAGLLLWLNWRSIRFDPLGKRTPATLIGTLRRAEPQRMRRWHLLAALAGLLLLRAGVYWQIGSATRPAWAGILNLGVVFPAFVSNSFVRMMLFSCLSFGVMLGVFYLWLLLLSILAGPEPPPFHRLVRMQLGSIDRWPCWLKWFLPLLVTASGWWLASWPLAWWQVIPEPVSPAHRLEEALVIGLGSYLAWKYLAGALLALHLLNSFIYFGKHPFWNYINATGQTLLQPVRDAGSALGRVGLSLRPRTSRLRAEKVNFSPALKLTLTLLLDVAGIALVFLLAELAGRGLAVLYGKLPF